jgi:class 3 adenylate cyclase
LATRWVLDDQPLPPAELVEAAVSLANQFADRCDLIMKIAGLKSAAGEPVPGKSAARPEPKPDDAAERRQITVMFCDLVGSTAMSAK